MRRLIACVLLSGIFVSPAVSAPPEKETDRPLRALLVTGGCCHDYARQKLILTRGTSARANIVWTVIHQGGTTTNTPIPLYDDPNWADGFDIIIHNECFSNVKDQEFVDRILQPHKDGKPAVLIHCAMHCYRLGNDDWFEFVGVQSPGHGPHYAYKVENLKLDNPIMSSFGDSWEVPKGELYHTIKLWPTATPLAQARRQSDNEPQTCIWTNKYKKDTRVFCTTVGHYNETMVEPRYLDMMTKGILWAAGRDPDKDFHPADEKADEAMLALIKAPLDLKPVPDTGGKIPTEGNLVVGKPVTASSEEKNKQNFAKRAADGDLSTRWCANGDSPGQWWQVDLEKPAHLRNLRIHWEFSNAVYRYQIEGSPDGKTWTQLVDQSQNKKKKPYFEHKVDAPSTRYLKVNFLGSNRGWGSFWEFEASEGKLPELPKNPQAPDGTAGSLSDVQVPDGFQATIFGAPPEVNYPVCLTTAPTGELFVGVDEQGSLGKQPGRGKVLRCIDTDGDGQADQINVFAEMDHPRGLIFDDGHLWVLHPPFLSVYHDDDQDGTADRHETLITGISTEEVNKRGADHTTNGIRMGIDGWIYIAVGDFGFTEAKGTDGRVLARRGGGVVRVRPDGTDMEIYCWGTRNIVDIAVDPYLNLFTRDNTNDGGGWDIRVSHIMQTANYGYPSLYKNFSEEIMPPLANYGGGSGCGVMFFHDERWPAPYDQALYTCDWGRSEVYLHDLPAAGATFEPNEQPFVKIPRPTDIDVDGSGRMYVSSWKNGKFNYDGPNIGFVAQITPIDFLPKPFPRLDELGELELIEMLKSSSAVHRFHAQREILRREKSDSLAKSLIELAGGKAVPLASRVAAIFTLKQLEGAGATDALLALAVDRSIREYALRALTDRKSEMSSVPTAPFVQALSDNDRRVQAQTLISLGRLGNADVAEAILPLTVRTDGSSLPTDEPLWNQPDAGRVLPHLAVQTLRELNAYEACLKAIPGPYQEGALWALKGMHDEKAVDGLFTALSKAYDSQLRQELFTTLIRLYHHEAEYTGGWWGTRPDTTGPYYDRKPWAASPKIESAIRVAVQDSDKATVQHILEQLAKHVVIIEGLPGADKIADVMKREPEVAIKIPEVDKNDPHILANINFDQVFDHVMQTDGDAERGAKLFLQQSCVACHTYANGQQPKGPHLVDIGKRYKKEELIESILKPDAKIAQGFDTYTFVTDDGKVVTGFVVSESAETLTLRKNDGLSVELIQDDIDERAKQKISMMPKGIVGNLTPAQLADLIAYLQTLK